jgi:hypothetical protein
MENEPIQKPIVETQPIITPSSITPTPTVPVVPSQKKKIPTLVWICGVLIILAISVAVGYLTSTRLRESPPQANTNATPTVTPVLITGFSPIATTSGFLQIEQSIASLSAQISGFNPIDSQVVPPVLDLPLGFSK